MVAFAVFEPVVKLAKDTTKLAANIVSGATRVHAQKVHTITYAIGFYYKPTKGT